MIRGIARFYSSQRRIKARGCRVLDYTTPQTHLNVALPVYLLGSRTGNRYESSEYDEKLELLTILSMHRYRRGTESELVSRLGHRNLANAELYSRLELDPKILPKDIDMEELVPSVRLRESLKNWTEIVMASTLEEALELVQNSLEEVPFYVALHTLGRHAKSPLEVHNALRQFEIWISQVPVHVQPEMTVLMLKMAQKHLVDIVPTVIELFTRHYKKQLSPDILNELLWQIARYGKRWSLVDTPLLSQAQELLFSVTGVDMIDTKGLVALAYIKHFRDPEIARRAMVDLIDIVANRTPEHSQNEFAYSAGPLVIRLLTSLTAEQALDTVDEAKSHLPAVWTALAMYLSRSHLLRSDVALRLWGMLMRKITEQKRAYYPPLRVSSLLTEIIIDAVPSFAGKQQVLNDACRHGLRLTPSLVAKMMKVDSAHDLESAQQAYIQYADHPLVLEQVLQTQSIVDPAEVWSTYCRLYSPKSDLEAGIDGEEKVPSRKALKSLCRAAGDTQLVWDGMYAPQRALREIKLHVRGAASPADDILRLYPNDELLYAYVVMAGRSGYRDELFAFLPWMNAIQHEPSKNVLMALIFYSPQGPALLRMGQQVKNWPTLDEFEAYQHMVTNK